MQQVGHARRRATVPAKRLLTALTAIVMVTGALASAHIAQADQVQVQSYERASQTATCDSPPESLREWRGSWANPYDPVSGPAWHPSWEQWANNGNGGWTCTRSITWARSTAAAGSSTATYALGDIGPGGGLVFLIADGLTYEMAPKTWSGGGTDPTNVWCGDVTNSVATSTDVGTGSANTTAMLTDAAPFVACANSAPNAVRSYPGADTSAGQWFLPSKDELNAMCQYSRNPDATPTGTGTCTGPQNAEFAGRAYGFVGDFYWSSSQFDANQAWDQSFVNGTPRSINKTSDLRVRPIRAF